MNENDELQPNENEIPAEHPSSAAPPAGEPAGEPPVNEASGSPLDPPGVEPPYEWAEPRRHDMPAGTAVALGTLFIVVALLTVAFVGVAVHRSRSTPGPDSSTSAILSRFSRAGVSPDVATTAAKVDAAVVNITTQLGGRGEAMGTGVVLTSNGEVLTNNHVVQGATSLTATDLGNDQTYTARVVGTDPAHDIAVIQLQRASGLKTIPVGDSSKVGVGTDVIALGNALGTGGPSSVATGQVTALNQSITATDETGTSAEDLSGLIQINAQLQPGDSGGPLVNSNGQVIGIDTAASVGFRFRRQASGNEAFAVPINQALAIAKQLAGGK